MYLFLAISLALLLKDLNSFLCDSKSSIIAFNDAAETSNGSFILLEYPIAQVYKAFINRVEENEKLKSTVTALKNTEAFKELEQFVAEFSGA